MTSFGVAEEAPLEDAVEGGGALVGGGGALVEGGGVLEGGGGGLATATVVAMEGTPDLCGSSNI